MKIPLQEKKQVRCNVFAKSLYHYRALLLVGYFRQGIFSYPNKLALLGSTGGAAGAGFLDFLQVADDLGGALLDGLAVGTYHKAA